MSGIDPGIRWLANQATPADIERALRQIEAGGPPAWWGELKAAAMEDVFLGLMAHSNLKHTVTEVEPGKFTHTFSFEPDD